MLLTDWQTLATAGSTADGREIKESWLIDIAETYDRETYTAVIDADHEKWYGNFGEVHEVRLGKNKKGQTILEGRLHPNFRLIEMNRNGQRMFVSIAVKENFANSGKAYLVGLAMTDDPSSLGTSMQKFSAKNSVFSEPQAFSLALQDSEAEKSLLKKLLAAIKGNPEFKTTAVTPATEPQGEIMTPEQFAALTAQNEKIIAGLGTLADSFKKQEPAETAPVPANEPAPVTAEQFQQLQEKLAAMETEFSKLKNTPAPGTNVPGNGGDAEQIEFI